jgi:SAM-dependent methyltransferase
MYDLIAPYYDLIHEDLTADADYVLTLASQTMGPVLELGCGSGRLLLPLARAGHQITGIDSSHVMLSRANDRLHRESETVRQRVSLVEADMAEFKLHGQVEQFGLAFIPYNTFMHVEPKQRPSVFECIKRYLRPDGQLFIDLVSPLAVAQTPNDRLLTLERSFTDPESGEQVLQMASNWLDEMAQILHITWIFDATPAAGGTIRRTVAQGRYYYLFPHQMELLLTQAGFKLKAMMGSYDNDPFADDSERLLLLAGLS